MRADRVEALTTIAKKFIADVEATTALRPTLTIEWTRSYGHFKEEGAKAMLRIDKVGGIGAFLSPAQLDIDHLAEALVHLADEWSELVMEGLVHAVGVEEARTWPKCPEHHHAMDPLAAAGRAWWVCRDDPSLRVPIGELAP